MKICVFGAGAVGGHAAARLARGGADVSVVARGAHLAAMKERGLEVRAPDVTFRADVTASEHPAELGPQDAVIVTLKAPSLPSMARVIGPLLGPDTAVVFAMNGIPWWYFHKEGSVNEGRRLERLDPGGVVWDAIGPQRAIGGVVNSACTVIEPGIISVANANSRINIGEPDGTVSPRAKAIAAAMEAGGLHSEPVPDIRTKIWAKLLLNIGTGPMGVLTESPGRTLFTEEACRDALRNIAGEMVALATAMGCPIKADPEAQIANSLKLSHTASIVQDLKLGRPMEVDAMFGVPLELARLVGVATPTLDLLVALAKLRAKAAGLYG
ncbi:ketopantoate reductase family protein [Acidisphaera sp. L21]|uniref:ketopantoate reductase family protein n=1 Tax=Acidisphaera sp. L21 TaxID=1641851 RepID=UPI00131EC69A|nr:2-dehydropantoate 2-reductase [Acidisphaera sp. L21]